ncbi:MAG: PqqD family protein [Magnetococcales bacterium]|nr:PqqD family protein [Magnetococcales bacterium]
MQKIKDLAINDAGFAFDPTTGASFTLNEVATQIISSLKDQDDLQLISLKLTEMFEVDFEQAYQDVQEFVEQLKTYKIYS